MNLLERILALEALEKIFRIQAFLSKASIRANDPDSKVIGIYKTAIIEILKSMEVVFNKLHDNYGVLDPEERTSCMRRICGVFQAFEDLHFRLKDIHGDWTAPETYIFVKNLFKSIDEKEDVSIVLSNIYMFEADELSRPLKGMLKYCKLSNEIQEIRPTLFLPKVELSNPLNWSILAHEMGHVLEKPLEKIFSEHEIKEICTTADGITMVHKWIEEVWCDLIATTVLGPSYLVSYIMFSLSLAGDNFAIEEDKPNYPAHRFRINMMKTFLEKMGVRLELRGNCFPKNNIVDLFEDLFEDRSEYARNNAENISSYHPLPIDYQKLRDLLTEKIDILTHENTVAIKLQAEKIQLLTDRLSDGIPIGSFIENRNTEDVLTKLGEIDKCITNKNMETVDNLLGTVFNGVKEKPCHIGEIINAGWQYKCEKIYPKMIDLFFSKSEDVNDCYNIFKKEISLLDDKLRKSIEISHIHELFTPVSEE